MANQATMHEKDLQKVTSSQRVVSILVKTLLYAFLSLMALIVVFPFYWMIISSLKSITEYRLPIPTLFPKEIIWHNYIEAFSAANLDRLFLNTVYVGVVSTLLSLVITVLCAFAFARLEFKGKNGYRSSRGWSCSPLRAQESVSPRREKSATRE